MFGAQSCRVWGSWCSVDSLGDGAIIDGLGDGAIIKAEGEDLDFQRTTSLSVLVYTRLGGGCFCACEVLLLSM
jgi:hypothetical protein